MDLSSMLSSRLNEQGLILNKTLVDDSIRIYDKLTTHGYSAEAIAAIFTIAIYKLMKSNSTNND